MAPISETIFSGFVSKVVNDIVDVSKDKIKSAVKNKIISHQNLEVQIYNITVDVLNNITVNKYKNNQDKIYDAAEFLLKSFKEIKRYEIDSIASSLRMLELNADKNKCSEFQMLLYKKLGSNEYSELFRTILLLLLERKSQYDHSMYKQLNQKLYEVIQILDREKDSDENNNTQQKVKSRTQEYADKWNANMFLNDFDKRDENAGVNIKLSDLYLDEHLPHYIWKENKKTRSDLKDLLSEYIYEYNENKMLLILGQPGIGKSTLITWITANFPNRIHDILVYSFATDLTDINWQNINEHSVNELLINILGTINMPYINIKRKILILDGFDEINIGIDREKILNFIYWKLVKENLINNILIVVTCRENYIKKLDRIICDYITLQPWGVKQIESFCRLYQDKTNRNISENVITQITKNKDILGIPIILYMVLALNISIEKESSIVDVYDKIFALDGGIYDRCINNKKFAGNHRIGKIKNQIHQISRIIAIWMFENNASEAVIPRKEYEKICDSLMKVQVKNTEYVNQDILIGNYFKLVKHCEGIETEELYFIHRSIYEYFVVETIYSSIESSMLILSDESQESFISNIANYLKTGQLDNTVGEFLKYKILKLYYKMNTDKREKLWKWYEVLIEKMMKRGMLYNVSGNMQRFDYMAIHESICFYNIMYILSSISDIYPQNVYMLSTIEKGLLQIYIRLYSMVSYYSMLYGINGRRLCPLTIHKAVFTGINYQELYLVGSDFCESNFTDQDLSKSILCSCNFNNAVMINTNLQEANLENASMKGTNLRGADLREANLENAKIEEINLDGAKIEDSIWNYEDILKLRPSMHKAIFNYIKLQHIHGQERIDRAKLFLL